MVYGTLGREQHSNVALAELVAKHASESAYQVQAFRGEASRSMGWNAPTNNETRV